VRVTWLSEQSGGERLIGAAQLQTPQRDRPRGRFHGDVAVAVARSGTGAAAGVALPA
jgi:hypothetical protein